MRSILLLFSIVVVSWARIGDAHTDELLNQLEADENESENEYRVLQEEEGQDDRRLEQDRLRMEEANLKEEEKRRLEEEEERRRLKEEEEQRRLKEEERRRLEEEEQRSLQDEEAKRQLEDEEEQRRLQDKEKRRLKENEERRRLEEEEEERRRLQAGKTIEDEQRRLEEEQRRMQDEVEKATIEDQTNIRESAPKAIPLPNRLSNVGGSGCDVNEYLDADIAHHDIFVHYPSKNATHVDQIAECSRKCIDHEECLSFAWYEPGSRCEMKDIGQLEGVQSKFILGPRHDMYVLLPPCASKRARSEEL